MILLFLLALASAQDYMGYGFDTVDYNDIDRYSSDVEGSPYWRWSETETGKEYYPKWNRDFKITTARDGQYVGVFCNEEQLLDCATLPHVDYGQKKRIHKLVVDGCALNTSLSCVLASMNVTGVDLIVLRHLKSDIEEEIVRGMDGVTYLMVQESNAVKRIPTEALKHLSSLQRLRVSQTGITSIPSNTFKEVGLKNLTFLEISLANFSEIPASAFEGLGGLRNLSLFKNNIRTVDKDAFKGLSSLEQVILHDNAISDLSGAFQHTPGLLELIVERNRADLRIGRGALPLPLLNVLSISHYEGQLTLDPGSLSDLPALQTLELADAGLTTLPGDLFQGTTAVLTLQLGNNLISSLPDSLFEGFTNLQYLSLSNNKLENVTADTFRPLVGLREVYLDKNQLQALPDNLFDTTKSLETVSVSKNRLTKLGFFVFYGATALKTLDLSHNQLNFECQMDDVFDDTLSPTAYDSPLNSLVHLERLDLSHNRLRYVCSDYTQRMLRLQHLDLSYNHITSLSGSDVSFHNNLTADFRHNQITTVQPGDLTTQSRPNLILGYNPYNCDCNIYDSLVNVKDLNYDLSHAVCNAPRSLKGVALQAFGDDAAAGLGHTSVSLSELTCVLPEVNRCECLMRPAENRTECVCEEGVDLPEPQIGVLLRLKTLKNLQNIPKFVTNLSLSHLQLDTVPQIPANVKHLDLTNNNLDRIPLSVLARNMTFDLSNNTFKCSCADTESVQNLQLYKCKINDYVDLVCDDGISLYNKQVSHLCDVFYSYAIGGSLALIGLFVAVVGIVLYKYGLHIRIYLYNKGLTCFDKEEELDASKKYDIFLSYCHEDEKYVIELLNILDVRYKVCVHTRDFEIGEEIAKQIYRAVADSRRTLIVASEAYFKSPWCLEEMRAAYKQTELDKRIRAIVILRKGVDIKTVPERLSTYMKLNTCVFEDSFMFWNKLYYALPKKITVEDVRVKKATQKAVKNLSGALNVVCNEDGKLVNVAVLKDADVKF